jgi:hypothetical protein
MSVIAANFLTMANDPTCVPNWLAFPFDLPSCSVDWFLLLPGFLLLVCFLAPARPVLSSAGGGGLALPLVSRPSFWFGPDRYSPIAGPCDSTFCPVDQFLLLPWILLSVRFLEPARPVLSSAGGGGIALALASSAFSWS